MNMKLECDLSGIRKCMMSGLSLLLAGVLQAQNPIVQTCYTSDPAPMVHDGTLYVYTGHDEDHADFFWMQEWRVYSTKDMVNWTDHGSPLAIESFDWADDRAWASQCIERNGKFYWYVCLHSKLTNTMAIGVAVGDSPTGPFKDAIGRPLYEGSWDFIDPTVFVDDDGQAYLYWGNPNVYRNVIGPMDYTPCTFTNSQHPHITTDAHELALLVIFESALQHLADRPEGYRQQPVEVQNFIRYLPVAWEDTRLLSGYPAESVVIARKSKDSWYISGLNGTENTKSFRVNLEFIKDSIQLIQLFSDTTDGKQIKIENSAFDTKELNIECQPRGGFVVWVKLRK